MKSIVIFYHADCPDGFGAAWAAWKKFGKKAECIPIPAGQDKDQLKGITPKDKTIYFLDVCVSPEDLERLKKTNKSVIVIDHHKTNSEMVRHASEHLFDLNHSGSVLAWTYFHPNKKVPNFLKYIETVDLWRFSLPHTKELTTYAYSKPFDFKIWSGLARDFEGPKKLKRYFELGRVLEEYEDNLTDSMVRQAELVKFGKRKVLVVNLSIKKFSSFVGHKLCDKVPPLGIIWYVKNGELNVSLRGDGTIDVSKLAGRYGGGGHKNSAGFAIPFKGKFPWKVIKK
jgi:oligoribonuclease NrnB/cAMP/cGMP phosphodiesterase (DHH superfamily)